MLVTLSEGVLVKLLVSGWRSEPIERHQRGNDIVEWLVRSFTKGLLTCYTTQNDLEVTF